MKKFAVTITEVADCTREATIIVEAASGGRAEDLAREQLEGGYEVPWKLWSDWEPRWTDGEIEDVDARETITARTADIVDAEPTTAEEKVTFTTLNGSTVEAKVARAAFTKESLKEVCQ